MKLTQNPPSLIPIPGQLVRVVLCMACAQDYDSAISANSNDSVAHIFMIDGTPPLDDVSPTPLNDVRTSDTNQDMMDALQAHNTTVRHMRRPRKAVFTRFNVARSTFGNFFHTEAPFLLQVKTARCGVRRSACCW